MNDLDPATCPRCSGPMPAGHMDALCPRCLLAETQGGRGDDHPVSRAAPEPCAPAAGPVARSRFAVALCPARHPRRRTGGGWPYLLDISDPEWDRPGRIGHSGRSGSCPGPIPRRPAPHPHQRGRPAAAEGGEHRYSASPEGDRGSASTFSPPVAVAAAVVAAGMVDHDPVVLADAMTLVNAVIAGLVLAAVVPR